MRRRVKEIQEVLDRIGEKWAAYDAEKATFDKKNKEAHDMFIEGFLGLFLGGDVFKMDPSLEDMQPAILKIGKALVRFNSVRPVTIPALAEFNKDLFEAQEKLRKLAIEAAFLRRTAREKYAKSLIDALEARRNSLAELENRSALFPDLYKNVWLSFIFSPNRNLDLFTKNLSALLDFALGTAVPEDVRLLKPDSVSCENLSLASVGDWGRVGDCIFAAPSSKRRRLQGVVDGEPRLATLKLPLVLIAPFTSGEKKFGTRGFSDLDVVTVD